MEDRYVAPSRVTRRRAAPARPPVEGVVVKRPVGRDEPVPERLRVPWVVKQEAVTQVAQLAPGAGVNDRLMDRETPPELGIGHDGWQHAGPGQAVSARCRAKSVAPDGSSITSGGGVPASANPAMNAATSRSPAPMKTSSR